MLPDRIACDDVEYVTADDPGKQEDAEQNVREFFVAKIFRAFCSLRSKLLVKCRSFQTFRDTYREEDIHNIHDAQNQVCDLGLVISITRKDKNRGHNVMREHLPMILPSLLHVDY